jgi:hypothetical protein
MWGYGKNGELGDNYALVNRGDARRLMGDLSGKFVQKVTAGITSAHAVFK